MKGLACQATIDTDVGKIKVYSETGEQLEVTNCAWFINNSQLVSCSFPGSAKQVPGLTGQEYTSPVFGTPPGAVPFGALTTILEDG